jgi:hypothetical protein
VVFNATFSNISDISLLYQPVKTKHLSIHKIWFSGMFGLERFHCNILALMINKPHVLDFIL